MHREIGSIEAGIETENNEVQETENEIDSYMDSKWSDNEEEDVTAKTEVNENEAIKITCRNEELEGKEHPGTGILFERKTVNVEGKNIEGVFPQFESRYNTKLPEELYKESDSKQFEYCSQQLKEAVQKDPKLAEQFNARQYQQIMDGSPRISGYTWHHTENSGEMQLVNADSHAKTGHTGGRSIWGGGTENR